MRVKDARKSERLPVMGWIEAYASPERGPTSGWSLFTITDEVFGLKTEECETMNADINNISVRASGEVDWNAISWNKVGDTVQRLQARIVKAQREGKRGKVKALSRILTRSFSGKALAVKRVTENRGKKTAGVDGVAWNTPALKAKAVRELIPERYQAKPLRRVFIPKSNGQLRPLGIPTMKDRAMQALFLLALDPIAECGADKVSFGFRRKRSCADATAQGFRDLCRRTSANWVLEGDIKGCFDNISHAWLLENIPMEKRILQQWLKAGYLKDGSFFDTDTGTPQGGIISPVLANMTLDGLDNLLFEEFRRAGKDKERQPIYGRQRLPFNPKVNLVRYADDFFITGVSKELLEKEVKPLVRDFLAERGLTLSEEKSAVTAVEEGFDFLGFNFRKYDQALLIKPSSKAVKRFLDKVRGIISRNKTVRAFVLIEKLNPVLRGWANYYQHVVSSVTFRSVASQVWRALWRWAVRRHSKKSRQWIREKYFISKGGKNWVFFGDCPDGQRLHLYQMDETRISRHVMVTPAANPYDKEWDAYFAMREQKRVDGSLSIPFVARVLWKRQLGMCIHCGQPLNGVHEWGIFQCDLDVHHIVRRADGGDESLDNLRLLHANCHRQLHAMADR